MTRHDRSVCRKISAAKDKCRNFAFEKPYTISLCISNRLSSYRLHLQDNSVIQISLSTSPNSFASVALDGLFQGLRTRTVLLEVALENIKNLIHAKVRYSKSS